MRKKTLTTIDRCKYEMYGKYLLSYVWEHFWTDCDKRDLSL